VNRSRMASSSSSLSKLKPKKPLDVWSTREKLCLASAVFKIGDQNWLSVSRAIKPYAEKNRPPEWFHQKNCVSQYYDMLEQLEQQQPKRKRGDKCENDTPSLQIMRKMTIERSEQLKKEIMEMQQSFKTLENEVDEINNGQWDDRIEEEYELLRQEELKEEAENVKVKEEIPDEDSKSMDLDMSEMLSVTGEEEESMLENVEDVSMADEDGNSTLKDFLTSTPVTTQADGSVKPGATGPSLLLSSLLQSEEKSATGLQQLKREQELVVDPSQSGIKLGDEDSATSSPATWSEVVGEVCPTEGVEEVLIEETVVEDMAQVVTEEVITSSKDVVVDTETVVPEMQELQALGDLPEVSTPESVVVKTEVLDHDKPVKLEVHKVDSNKANIDKECQEEEEMPKKMEENLDTEAVFPEIKDEPMSPTSSVSSRMSEPGVKRGRPPKGRSKATRSPRMSSSLTTSLNIKKSYPDDGGSSRHSDVELSDDDARESDDIVSDNLMTSVAGTSLLSESFPNSPASLSICSDTEEEKSFKAWKKSILMVWRAASAHKFASVFSHPVTDDIAPGYHSVIKRPMDLGTIKKNIETGILRSTPEFQRDMMLMFTNAIMYNSSRHNVNRMAQVMYDDVLQHIEMMMQTSDSKNLRQSRRIDADMKMEDKARYLKERRNKV